VATCVDGDNCGSNGMGGVRAADFLESGEESMDSERCKACWPSGNGPFGVV
jgi:hypothetical protein